MAVATFSLKTGSREKLSFYSQVLHASEIVWLTKIINHGKKNDKHPINESACFKTEIIDYEFFNESMKERRKLKGQKSTAKTYQTSILNLHISSRNPYFQNSMSK